MTDAELEQQGRVLAEEREHIARHRHENSVATSEFVHTAVKANWPKTRIAAAAGISRQTVYEMLGD